MACAASLAARVRGVRLGALQRPRGRPLLGGASRRTEHRRTHRELDCKPSCTSPALCCFSASASALCCCCRPKPLLPRLRRLRRPRLAPAPGRCPGTSSSGRYPRRRKPLRALLLRSGSTAAFPLKYACGVAGRTCTVHVYRTCTGLEAAASWARDSPAFSRHNGKRRSGRARPERRDEGTPRAGSREHP